MWEPPAIAAPDDAHLIDRIAEAVTVTDADGNLVHVNAAAKLILDDLASRAAIRARPDTIWHALDEDGAPVTLTCMPGEITRTTGRELTDVTLGFPSGDGDVRWLRLSTRRYAGDAAPYSVACSFTDVTQQRLAEQRLHTAQHRYETVVDALHEGVVVHDAEGRIVAVNPSACRVLGMTAEQLVGRSTADPRWGSVRADGSPWPGEAHPAALALVSGEAQRDQLMGIRRPTGEVRWLSVSATPLIDPAGETTGVVASFIDVTLQRSNERAIDEADRRFHTMFEGAPIGKGLTEVDGTLVQVNQALADILGVRRDELIGRNIADITHPDDLADGAEHNMRLVMGERQRYRTEKRYLHALGHSVWVQVDAALMRDANGNPKFVLSQIQDISERRRHEEQLLHLADHDALTGVLNRRGFERELERHSAYARRYGSHGSLLMLDIDNFKYVNDTLGHKAGDELIVVVADLLATRLRDTDVLARLGGDEFAVLLPQCDATEAEHVAKALLRTLRSRAMPPGSPQIHVSASIGITAFAPDATPDELLVCADLAMYDAKENGRDDFAHYAEDEHQQPKLKARMTWIQRIRDALDADGMRLFGQPICDLQTGDVVMHELLLRMVGPAGELVPPATFLPIAERFELIAEVDRWVLAEAARMLGEMRTAGTPIVLCANVSGKSIANPELLGELEAELHRHGAHADDLIVEITETAAVAQIHQARTFAKGLKAIGCRLAIDDFGAGFGSFHYLKNLPFDYLKIDGEFVTNAPDNRADDLIIEAVRHLAHGLGRKVVAEYCTDERILEYLRSKDIDLAQGYHLGRPIPIEEVLGARTAA